MTNPGTAPYRLTLLIVDDIPESLEALAGMLSDMPAVQIVKAQTASEAIRKVLEENFDMVMLDFNLPDMDGTDLAHIVRQLDPHVGIYLMGVLEYPEDMTPEQVDKMEQVGKASYLQKPLDPGVVFNLVEAQRQSRMRAPAHPPTSPMLATLGRARVASQSRRFGSGTRQLFSSQAVFPSTWGFAIRHRLSAEQFNPLNLIFLVDASYSMLKHTFNPPEGVSTENTIAAFFTESRTFAEATCRLINDLTECLPAGSQVSLLMVNDQVHRAVMAQPAELARSAISAALDSLIFQGGTDLHLAFEALLEHTEALTASPGIPQIILWTDGDIAPTSLERCIPAVQKLAEAGFILHGVDFAPVEGLQTNPEALLHLARLGSGQFISAYVIHLGAPDYPDEVWEALGLHPETWLRLEITTSPEHYMIQQIVYDTPITTMALPTLPSHILPLSSGRLAITLNEKPVWLPDEQLASSEKPDPVAEIRLRPFLEAGDSWQTAVLSWSAPVYTSVIDTRRLSAPAPVFQQAIANTGQAYLAQAFAQYGYPHLAERIRQISASD